MLAIVEAFGVAPERIDAALLPAFGAGGFAAGDLAAGVFALAAAVGLAAFCDFPTADFPVVARVAAADLAVLASGFAALDLAVATFADSTLVDLIFPALGAAVFDATGFAGFAVAAAPEVFDAVLVLGFAAVFDVTLALSLAVDPRLFPADAAIAGLWLLSFD